MCHRMSPLTMRELVEADRYRKATGRARVPRHQPGKAVPDAFPGTQVPLFVPDDSGELVPQALTWGFTNPHPDKGHGRLIFNTRIETALEQARTGDGMWAEAIERGRCLVPVRSFYEWWTRPDPQATCKDAEGRERRRQVRYRLAGHGIFLLAGVRAGGRFSVVTTAPNADVAPVHNRMPLVLGPGESDLWLGADWPSLADRGSICLEHQVEDAAGTR